MTNIDNFTGNNYNTNYIDDYVDNAITNINGGPGTNSATQPTVTISNLPQGNTKYSFLLPFNPNALSWEYDLVTAAFDTIGGRVVQVLSTNIQTMTLEGDAGSRSSLISLYQNIKVAQDDQIKSWQPSLMTVPLLNNGVYTFHVWIRSMMRMGWSYDTTTYPYQLQLEVQEDMNSLASYSAASALQFLNNNIGVGYQGQFTGTSTNITTTGN